MPIIGQISVGDGATFTPAVSSTGELSWSNNKNLPNPATLDIPQVVMDRYQIAPIASPAFTGNPTAPTQAKTDNSTKLATTAYVKAVVADYLALTGGSITGDVDITGDLSVTGTITGNLTGNVTGNATNDANGNPIAGTYLPLAGGTMTGNIAWTKGEVGYRGTTHTAPYDPCRQMIVTAGTVDSEWNDGNAKLALHTFDSTGVNTAENGGFDLLASDGTNSASLTGRPGASLTWAGKNIERVNSSTSEGGAGYIRYENGLQICWGGGTASGTSSGKTISYQVAFNYSPSVTVTAGSLTGTASYHVSIQTSDVTTTSFNCAMSLNNAWSSGGFRWIAIGTWK